ncbi:MAG: GGDEF domain-containing protein [Terracidiphilus sp.]|jgi:diguanylate cyclase (GGDEF)-like protein
MKRLIPAVAIVLGLASSAWGAAQPAPLTTLREIEALSNAEADKGLPVAFEATVTYYHKGGYTLFMQDGGVGIYVSPDPKDDLHPGDRVLVRGKTAGSFHPVVYSDSIVVLHHGGLPKPVPATFDELIKGQRDCLMVTVRGVVRAADLKVDSPDNYGGNLQLLTEGGYIQVSIFNSREKGIEGLLDAEIEATGVAGGLFDGKMQPHGIVISVATPTDIKILKRPSASPWTLPLTPMGQIISGFHVSDRTQRVRVHGTLTYYQPGSSAVIQDGPSSLWISTWTYQPMKVGDVVDATGFPESHNGFLALTRAEIQDSRVQAPITPFPTTRRQLTESHHIIDLVTLEAQVVTEARGGTQDEYDLTADGQLFTAIYRHPIEKDQLPPMKEIPIGSRVRLTGICITEDSNPFNPGVGFDILMRDFDDITVVAKPSLINLRNLMLALSLMALVVVAVGGWGWMLRRKVGQQTATLASMAQFEQRRSKILERINGSDPLDSVLEEITALVSSMLDGAPCRCEITGGECSADSAHPAAEGLLQAQIDGHDGAVLGRIIAVLDPLAPHAAEEMEVITTGARLAALAIETRRLYSDLRRRSEFDLLTDVPNRFAMEKFMDLQIEDARQSGRSLGLIYIDLDKFKPINDTYGHHVGDLYLQEVALRMSRQLLGVDMLARLGGDEFAAMVSLKHGRADLETILARLESCFDEPFVIEGHLIQGAASFGFALYPENGATKDSLLSAADAAMYAVKYRRRQMAQSLAQSQLPELSAAGRS